MRAMLAALAMACAVAPVAAQDLELVSHDVRLLAAAPLDGRFSDVARLVLTVRNNTAEVVTAWRVQMHVKDPFGDDLFSIQLTSGSSDIAPGGTEEAVFAFEDNQFIDGEPYDKLAAYRPDNLSITLTDVRLVH